MKSGVTFVTSEAVDSALRNAEGVKSGFAQHQKSIAPEPASLVKEPASHSAMKNSNTTHLYVIPLQ
jgi:hypothetical protein